MSKTFEEEIFDVMERYLTEEKLSHSNLKVCREICNLYENKVNALNLTKLMITFCNNKYNIDLSKKNNKITILLLESSNNNNINSTGNNTSINNSFSTLNLKDKYNKLTVLFENKNRSELIYETEYDNIFKNTFHKLNVDGNLILKKDHSNKKKSFINISYIKKLIDLNNLKLNEIQFLDAFLNLLDITNLFKSELMNIQNNHEKYFYDQDFSSESEISSIDSISNDNSDKDNDDFDKNKDNDDFDKDNDNNNYDKYDKIPNDKIMYL